MAASDIRRRLKRRVIILLVLVNTALWVSYAWLGGNPRRLRSGPPASATEVHPAQAPVGK